MFPLIITCHLTKSVPTEPDISCPDSFACQQIDEKVDGIGPPVPEVAAIFFKSKSDKLTNWLELLFLESFLTDLSQDCRSHRWR